MINKAKKMILKKIQKIFSKIIIYKETVNLKGLHKKIKKKQEIKIKII